MKKIINTVITIKELEELLFGKKIYLNLDFLNPEDEAFNSDTKNFQDQKLSDDEKDMQRSLVWQKEKWNKLIQSVMNEFPIPNIILNDNGDNKTFKYTIVDGKQRIHTIHSFFTNNFEFSDKSDEFIDLKLKTFEMWNPENKKLFLDYELPISYLSGFTREELKKIFEVLNTNSVPLNEQEIRHAIFHGQVTGFLNDFNNKEKDLIADLINYKIFTKKQRIRRDIDKFLINLILLAKENQMTNGTKSQIDSFYKKYDGSKERLLEGEKNKFYNSLNISNTFFMECIENGLDKSAQSKTTLYLLFYLQFFGKLNLQDYNTYHFIDILNEIKDEENTKYVSIFRYWTSKNSRITLLEEFKKREDKVND